MGTIDNRSEKEEGKKERREEKKRTKNFYPYFSPYSKLIRMDHSSTRVLRQFKKERGLGKMMLKQIDIHMSKNEAGFLSHAIHKNELKIDNRFNCKD